MVLDTLATHVLTMHSYLSLDGAAVSKSTDAHDELLAELEHVGLTTADILKGHDHGKSVFTHARVEELMKDEKSPAFLDPSDPDIANVYIAGGTNAGCVYVWKIPYRDLYRSVSTVVPLYDFLSAPREGKLLHSLLQSSEHPIVHVSISSSRDEGPTHLSCTQDVGPTLVHHRGVSIARYGFC
jgi:hypothetical protein